MLSSLEDALEDNPASITAATAMPLSTASAATPPSNAAAAAAAAGTAAEMLATAQSSSTTVSPFSMSSDRPGLFRRSSSVAAAAIAPGATSSAAAAAAAAAPTSISFTQLEAQFAGTAARGSGGCKPFSVPDYLARLSSYRAGADWFDKPESLSPPTCARHGWVLSGHDMLSCGVCGACLKAPASLSATAAGSVLATDVAADATSFAAQLSTGHAELCPWRGNASPTSLTSLLLPGHRGSPPSLPHGALMAREGVKARSTRLLALPNLPALSSAADATWRACADACGFGDDMPRWREAVLRLAGLERDVATLSAADAERRWVAAALSLTGWSAGEAVAAAGRSGAAAATLECMEDARTVGLWAYQPLGSPDVTTTAAGAPSGHALLEPFDPFLEHRAWSPWLAAADGDTLPAWMRIASLLLLPAEARGQQAVSRQAGGASSNSSSASAAVSQLLSAF